MCAGPGRGAGKGSSVVRFSWLLQHSPFEAWIIILLILLSPTVSRECLSCVLPPAEFAAGSAGDQKDSPGGLRQFAAGVHIDWTSLTVNIDSEVVLREGALELLACSLQTREHESILVVKARPLHILQAMGIVGLEPGLPLRYDEKNDRWIPASGEPLDLRIRCDGVDGGRPVSAAAWLAETKGGKPPKDVDWVFSGSRSVPGGRFGADLEGTVACLVDFDTALISPATSHSADNEELWLKANTAAIPPRGTACTLLVRSAYRPALEVKLAPDETLRFGEKPVTPTELVEMLHRPTDDERPARLSLRLGPQVTEEAANSARERIVREGFKGLIEIRRGERRQERAPLPNDGHRPAHE